MSAAWLPSGATEPVELTASIASPRSLFISAVAKPGLKSLLAGEVGTGPGTGQLLCTAQQFPVAPVITSNSDCADSPSFSASTNASPIAICCTASTTLIAHLRDLARAGRAAVNDLARHRFQHWTGRRRL